MVGWHHRLDGHEFEQGPGVGDGQGGLACCRPWGCKGSDATEHVTSSNNHVPTHEGSPDSALRPVETVLRVRLGVYSLCSAASRPAEIMFLLLIFGVEKRLKYSVTL